jgi:hypothetical protein
MNFDKLNETDVREEVIAPLIRFLGYRSDSEHNVLRELPLKYPLVFLGRKDTKKDRALRGKADYVLEAGRKVRWVIEAKSPAASISQDDVEQAFTYANHAEVRAVYFIVCNGREFLAYQTNRGPNEPPLLRLTFEESESELGKLRLLNLLSPSSILRDHPPQFIDGGIPIGQGLRSFARISGGFIRYSTMKPKLPGLLELQIVVEDGAIQRSEQGTLLAYVESRAPIRTIDDFLKKNKLSIIELVSEDRILSSNSASPTVFRCDTCVIFPKGDTLMNIETWQEVVLPLDLRMDVSCVATVAFENDRLAGSIKLISRMNGEFLLEASGEITVILS